MTTTQAQIEAARREYLNRCGHYKPPSDETFAAILTAAAEVGCGCIYPQDCADKISDTIERCARYHDKAAHECDLIAAVNMDNELGPECITRAQDHREDAAAIRALKDRPNHD